LVLDLSSLDFSKISFRLEKHFLVFKTPSGTSRGVMTVKKLWLLYAESSGVQGIGECPIIEGLSPDFSNDVSYEEELEKVIKNPLQWLNSANKHDFPSILFGMETALLDLIHGGKKHYFDSPLDTGFQIPINGLIWMGSKTQLLRQLKEKIEDGFNCLKMKVGAINFRTELDILASIRANYSKEEMCLRVDANGAFSVKDALQKLESLSKLGIDSIEQPIRAGQKNEMRELCAGSPVPIALDEELIGIVGKENKFNLLSYIKPQFIILKPSLHGGFEGTLEWIEIANQLEIPWWITSALESNIGLKAISQFTARFEPKMHQGLGTGALYETNFETNLLIKNGFLLQTITK
jgi:L-alanine-DL-glutamate epimerase-like enolase superfamily enzyme